MKNLALLGLIICIASCGGMRKKSFEKNFETLAGPVASSFRGVNLGDGYQKVLTTEGPEYLEFQDSSMIRYTLHYTDSEEYKISYHFTNDRLHEIQFDAFLGQISDGEKLTKLFEQRFDKKYGPGAKDQGILTWSNNGESVELYDESEVFGYGKMRLLIFITPAEPKPRPLPL